MPPVPLLRNILIVRTDRIGDVVLTTPAIKALRRRYPRARLSVLIAPSTVDLVNGNPYIDDILIDERDGRHKGLFGFLRLVKEIRLKQFDAVIIFHTKRRYNLACCAAGIPYRLGYKNNKLGFLLTHPLKDQRFKGEKHEAQYCLDVLKAIDVVSTDLDMFVPVQKEAEAWAARWMEQEHLKANEFMVVHAGASDPAKCWMPANFATLMDRLVEHYGFKIVLMGASQTVALSDEILRQTSKRSQFIDMTGQTSLAQTASLLRRARLLISNDSGPVHVGAGVGIPVVSLFLRDQPGINAERWKPLGPKGFFLKGKSGLIQVDEVMALIEQILQKNNQYEIF